MNWIEKISGAIGQALTKLRKPAQTVPPILLACDLDQRPGMSAIALTAAILAEFEKEGIPTGTNEDGSPNLIAQTEYARARALINHLQTYAVIDTVIKPEAINILGTGANAGGPVNVTSRNIGYVSAKGGIQ